jgi:hypothetical protein
VDAFGQEYIIYDANNDIGFAKSCEPHNVAYDLPTLFELAHTIEHPPDHARARHISYVAPFQQNRLEPLRDRFIRLQDISYPAD